MGDDSSKPFLWYVAIVAYRDFPGGTSHRAGAVCVVANNVMEARGMATAYCCERFPVDDGWYGQTSTTPAQVPEEMIARVYHCVEPNNDE